MRVRYLVLGSLFILQACGLDVGLSKNIQAKITSAVKPSVTPAPCIGELDLYAKTLHPYLRSTGCVNCHGQTQAPVFAHAEVTVAYPATITLADFSVVSDSKLVKKSGDGHCGLICSSSTLMLDAVSVWVTKRKTLSCTALVLSPSPSMTPTAAPIATPSSPALPEVMSFTLISANTNQPEPLDGIAGHASIITEGTILNLFKTGSALNVRADVGNAASVQFNFDSGVISHVENASPFSLASDANGVYNSWTPSLGNHVITAAAYLNPDAGGPAGKTLTIHFSVTNSGGTVSPTPRPSATPVLAATAAPNPAVVTQCKAFSVFRQNVQPMIVNKCLSCHAGGAGNFTLPNHNDGALCTAALSKVDKVTPANSRLITKPLNHSGHPDVGFLSSDAFPLWTNWIESER